MMLHYLAFRADELLSGLAPRPFATDANGRWKQGSNGKVGLFGKPWVV